jgi:CBS-domain-containing membrane protein
MLQTIGQATCVTIYIGESDKWGHTPLYTAILELLRREDCAGATVTRGLAGFGAHSRIHSASIMRLSEDLPLVVEWVDLPERVERVMPKLVEMVAEGLITVHPVEVVAYSHRRLRELRAEAPVADIMRREVRAVRPDTPLAEAVEMLWGKVYRTLPVTDDAGRVVGILTDGDLLNRAGLLATTAQETLSRRELAGILADLRRQGRTVAGVMTPNPTTITPEMPISAGLRLMAEHDIKRLPVVDAEGQLVGIVSRLDVLRALAQPSVGETPSQAPTPGQHTTVGEIMLSNVPTVRPDTPLNAVVDLLVTTAQRRVVVTDAARRVVGIITDADVLKRAAEPERSGLLRALTKRAPVQPPAGEPAAVRLTPGRAADVMTRNPVVVTPATPLPDALRLLLAHKIKRLPVVDENGTLVGLVGRGGILQALSQDLP